MMDRASNRAIVSFKDVGCDQLQLFVGCRECDRQFGNRGAAIESGGQRIEAESIEPVVIKDQRVC